MKPKAPHAFRRSLMMPKVALISFGCAKNLIDSEVMLGLMGEAGFTFVSQPERADVIVLNTCGFIRPARREAEAAIRTLLRLKSEHPSKRIIVAGCYVQRSRDALSLAFPGVDDWLDVGQFGAIVQAVRGRTAPASKGTFLYSHLSPRVVSTPRSWAYVKISEGCSHRCAFCSIPTIKGPYRSRPMSSVLKEARALARLGVKELNIISQDTTYYGRDLGIKNGLSRLLQGLIGIRVPGRSSRRTSGVSEGWIRLLYCYPEEINEPLLEIIRDSRVCPYLDVPFQHADKKVLRLMGRGLDGPRSLRLIERIRKAVPSIALRTSVIVGFPGEGQREFERLEEFIREASFDHLGVFVYSREEGTPAFRLGDPVPDRVKESRRARLMELQAKISLSNNKEYVGRTMAVLLDAPSPRNPLLALGRTRFQAPEVDGIVKVSAGGAVEALLHDVHQVEITSAGVYDLRGKLVE